MRGTPSPAGKEYSEGLANRWGRASGCGEAPAEALGMSAGSAGEKRGLDTSMNGSGVSLGTNIRKRLVWGGHWVW